MDLSFTGSLEDEIEFNCDSLDLVFYNNFRVVI